MGDRKLFADIKNKSIFILHAVMNKLTERICQNLVGRRDEGKPCLTLRHVAAFLICTYLLSLSSWSLHDLIELDFCVDTSDTIGEMCQKQYLVYGLNAIDRLEFM